MKHFLRFMLISAFAVASFGATAIARESGKESPAATSAPEVVLKGKVAMYLIDIEEPTRQIDRYIETDWERQVVAFVLQLPRPINLAEYVSEDELLFLPEESVSEVQIVAPKGTDIKTLVSKNCTVKGTIEIRPGGWRNYNGVVIVATDMGVVK